MGHTPFLSKSCSQFHAALTHQEKHVLHPKGLFWDYSKEDGPTLLLVAEGMLSFTIWKYPQQFVTFHSLLPKYKPKFGEGSGTPLQYSCLENPMDRVAR